MRGGGGLRGGDPPSEPSCRVNVSDPEQHADEYYGNPDATGPFPQACVTWSQARAYCQGNGGDLCSEAQWALAARGSCDLHCPEGGELCCKTAMTPSRVSSRGLCTW